MHLGPTSRRIAWLVVVLFLCVENSLRADSTVVFNEVMYHPATNETQLEWVELHNQMSVPMDISKWSIANGIQFTFPEGTVIEGGGYVVIALSPGTLMAATGLTNVLGPFTGRLSNDGETLELRNNNQRLMDSLTYGVEGDWPVGADGAGASLAKLDEEMPGASASNWRTSEQNGGTPGAPNFPPRVITQVGFSAAVFDSAWRYDSSGTDRGTNWRTAGYDDSAWSAGAGLFYANTTPPGQLQSISTLFSSGINTNGGVLAAGAADPHYVLTASAYSTPPPPNIAATVSSSHPAWLANDAQSSWIGAVPSGSTSIPPGRYAFRTTFDLNGYNPTSAVVNLQVAVDNELTNVAFNGVTTLLRYSNFNAFSAVFPLTNGFVPGTNTLDFTMANITTSPSPGAFRVLATGTAVKLLPTNTVLTLGPTAYYFRKTFVFNGDPARTALQLRSIVDDGAVFYLNGAEIFKQNMPGGAVSYTNLATSNIGSAGFTGPLMINNPGLVVGTNVLAVEVHQAFGGFGDAMFGAEISLFTTNYPPPALPKIAFNEISSVTNGQFAVELLNHGTNTESLTGMVLAQFGNTNSPEYAIPAQTLLPGGRLVLDKFTVGFGADPGDQVVLYASNKFAVVDALIAKSAPRARWPEGTGDWLHPNALTLGTNNTFTFHNEIVINEIMYHPRDLTNGVNSPESWLELYNRSSTPVDLTGWHLTGDISFAFPTNLILAPSNYLVIAKDAAFLNSLRPGVNAIGDFSGKLPRSGGTIVLRDGADNPVNRVTYYDDDPWPLYADGDGSSLELRDPFADNTRPEAWAASDESTNSVWRTYRYSGTNVTELANYPTTWHELVFGLLGSGEVWLDDFSVIESPGGANRQLLQNGSFESNSNSWRFLGTHRRAQVISEPGNPANHVLYLRATGDTEHMHNHVETTFTNNVAITNGLQYEISFRAKWLAGCNNLNTRLYFNRLANTTNLVVPTLGGTPGARNSRFGANIGPTFSGLRHSPVVPASTNAVTVNVTAAAPNNITTARLYYSVNGGAWQNNLLSFTASTNVNLQGSIPAQAALAKVQFYIEATDALGVKTTYPPGGTNSRALYQVGGQALLAGVKTARIIMTPADVEFLLASTNVMSNERLGCTVIMDESRVFYNSGIHVQGSERARDQALRRGFSLELPKDQPYRGVHDHLTIDPSGGYSGVGGKQDEILLKHIINKAGGLPGMYDDVVQFFAPRSAEDGNALLLMARYDSIFLDSQYANGSDGEMYKLELIYYPTTSVGGNPQAWKLPQPDLVKGTDIKNIGDTADDYRWTFLKENHIAANNYAPMIALGKAFDLTGSALESQMNVLMDEDEWMRAVAFISLIGGSDIYTYGNSHNFVIYIRPGDNKAMAFLWDIDNSFAASVSQAFPGNGSTNTYKLITTVPDNLRRFYWHLMDLTDLTGNSAYVGDWATRYAAPIGQNWGGAVNYLAQRAAYVRGFLPINGTFAVTNNNGNNFTVANTPVTLAGSAPLTVKDILVNGVLYPVRWLSTTHWSVVVPLTSVVNPFTVQGVDKNGFAVTNALDTITVTNGGLLAPGPVLINEWMAANAGPNGFPDPLDNKFQDWFELFNPNYVPVNLSGFYISDNVSLPTKWQVPTNTIIAPRGFLLVWADDEDNQNGQGGDLHAAFALNNGGESISLYSTNVVLQHRVVFTNQTQNVSQGSYPDGDTNGVYFMANWTPRAPNQVGAPPSPQLSTPTLLPDGNISFNVPAFAGHNYRVDYKDDLNLLTWTPLLTNRAVTDTIIFTDGATNRPQRFYRAVLLP